MEAKTSQISRSTCKKTREFPAAKQSQVHCRTSRSVCLYENLLFFVVIRQGAYGAIGNNNNVNGTASALRHSSSQVNIRNRRATTQSNVSYGCGGKEETFESSSFFDEGIPANNNRLLFLFSNQTPVSSSNGTANVPPHKCNQVDNYNLPPTIFNTLMFGID